jgi:hypothetical protein
MKYLAKLKAKGGAYNWKPEVEKRMTSGMDGAMKGLCGKLLAYDNVPIKQKPFVNFAKNSLALQRQPHLAEKLWETIGDLLRKPTPEAAVPEPAAEEKNEESQDADDGEKKKKKKKKDKKRDEDEDDKSAGGAAEEDQDADDGEKKKKKKKDKKRDEEDGEEQEDQGDDEGEKKKKKKKKKDKKRAEEDEEEESAEAMDVDEDSKSEKKKKKKRKSEEGSVQGPTSAFSGRELSRVAKNAGGGDDKSLLANLLSDALGRTGVLTMKDVLADLHADFARARL